MPPGLCRGRRTGHGGRRIRRVDRANGGEIAFTSKLFPRGSGRLLATEPLKALVIGACVRGLLMRYVESLCEEAGLGQVSKSTASRKYKRLRNHPTRARELLGAIAARQPDRFAHWVLPGARPQAG